MLIKNTKQPDNAGTRPVKLTSSVRWALAALSLSMLMPSLDTSIANAGLPTLAIGLNASFQEAQWVILAYLLSITTLIVSVGRLGDIVGRRRLLLFGITLFTAASLLCGVASTIWFLIIARAVQGLGAAIMLSLTVAMVGETVPKERTGNAMGLLGTMSAIGTTLGPSLGGILIAWMGWSSIFLVNVPVGLLNLIMAYRFLPADIADVDSKQSARFDYKGTLVLGLTLAAYALSMTIGHGHPGYVNVELLILAGIGVGFFIFVETRAASPLVRLVMFHDGSLSSGLLMSTLVSTVMMATLVIGPFYLSRGLGLETTLVGIALSAGPLVAALAGVPAGRIVDRFGSGRMTIVGLAGIAFGLSVISLVPVGFGVMGYVVPIVFVTASYALFQASNNTAIMTGAAAEQRGVVSGMLSLSRNLGLISGASVMGAIFAATLAEPDITFAQPDAIVKGLHLTYAAAALLIVAAIAIAVARFAFATRASAKTRKSATIPSSGRLVRENT